MIEKFIAWYRRFFNKPDIAAIQNYQKSELLFMTELYLRSGQYNKDDNRL
jgi:hypothetical protein